MRQGAAHAALSGLALQELKKGPGRGNWEDYHAAQFGDRLPLRTAQKYMQVAEGLKVKAADRPALDALLATPATQMTEEGRARLAAAVENICDGETMASLIEAYRITKRAPGTAATGGYKVDEARVQVFLRGYHPELEGTRYADLPADIQAEFRAWFANADQDQLQLSLDFWQPLFTRFESDDARKTVANLPDSERVRLRTSALRIIAWCDGQD